MLITTLSIGLLGLLPFNVAAQETTVLDRPFPASNALAEGVSPEALDELGKLVQSFVDDGEIVGGELLIIKNGHSILHEAYGLSDQEAKLPMQTGSVFCVRSMTKPVIAAAILMLVDDNLVELDDPAAKYLPAFDVDGTRTITVEHLLTHTSGLPMSLILGADLNELAGIQAVAKLGAGYKLDFEPGSQFQYSDQGTDTLTAIVEIASGMPVAEFVRTRLLTPLGMNNSACVMTKDHPLRSKAIAKYMGARGQWTRFWEPNDAALFPFFLGSQGLYSTLEDYALFMDFWLRRGRAGKEKILGARYVRKALTPNPHPFPGATGYSGLAPGYGYLMALWTKLGEKREDGKATKDELVAFGHGGSDGTHAWAFPEQKAMAFYFTQSRNNRTGLRVEEALDGLFLGATYDANQAAPPFEEYMGYYWEGEGDLYRAIIRDGEDLALEIMGKGIVPLTYVGADRWKLRPNPTNVIEFDRSEDGVVTGYHVGDHQEFRFEPSSDLPKAEDIAARVAKAHRMDLLETIGPIRIQRALTIEKLDIQGEVSALLAWPNRFRYDSLANDQFERIAFDGERILYASSTKPVAVLEGNRAAMLRLDNPFAYFGTWSQWHRSLQVIQRIDQGGVSAILVRAGDTNGHAATFYVDEKTGRVLHMDSMVHIDTMGRIGQRVNFSDFRDVSGVLFPHRVETKLANNLIGEIVTTVTNIELSVELPDGVFELAD